MATAQRVDELLARIDDQELDDVLLGPEITERCLHCDFTVHAPVGQARQAWVDHVCDRPIVPPRQRHTGFQIRR